MPAPKFVQRVARIPELLALLSSYPDGLTLGELAERFGIDVGTLREELTVYLDVESWGWTFDIFRRSQIELAQPDHASKEGRDAADTVVRVVSTDPAGLGVEHISAGDLAVIYTAGIALLDVEGDEDLAAALGVISETMYGEQLGPPGIPDWNSYLPPLRQAQDEQRRVRIVYSRAWHEGVFERVIEPLHLIQTHRGWEVDAGPLGDDGSLRTYLVTNIRDVELLDEAFQPPPRLEALVAAQRRTSTVRLKLVQDARWAADMFAERVTVVEDDEETFVADLELLPPVGERVGLLLLASGPSTVVISPGSLTPDAIALVDELLQHHAE